MKLKYVFIVLFTFFSGLMAEFASGYFSNDSLKNESSPPVCESRLNSNSETLEKIDSLRARTVSTLYGANSEFNIDSIFRTKSFDSSMVAFAKKLIDHKDSAKSLRLIDQSIDSQCDDLVVIGFFEKLNLILNSALKK